MKNIFKFNHSKKNIVLLIFCFFIIALSFTYCSFSAFADELPTIKDFDDTPGYVTWGNRLYTNNYRGGGSDAWYETYQFGALTLNEKNQKLTVPGSKYCILLGKGSTSLLTSAGFSKTEPVQVPIVYSIDKNGVISHDTNAISLTNDSDRHVTYTGYCSSLGVIPGSYSIREWSNGTKRTSSYPLDVGHPFAGTFFSNVPCFSTVDDVENYLRTGIANNADYVPPSLQCEKPLDLYVYHSNDNENTLIINWKQNDYDDLMYDCDVAYRFDTESMNTDFVFIPLASNEKSQPINELSIDVKPILKKALLRDNGEDKIIIQITVNNKDVNGHLIDNNSAVLIVYMYNDVWWNDGNIKEDGSQDNHPLTNQDDFISSGGSTIGNNVVSSGGIFSQLSNGLKSIISTKDGFPALIASVWSGLPPAITSILVFGFLATIVICLLAHILKG